MATIYEERYNYHPDDFKKYDTDKIRKEFLIEKVMDPGNIRLVYSAIERYIVGGAVPLAESLKLEPIDPLKAGYFCERREIGVINVAAGSVAYLAGGGNAADRLPYGITSICAGGTTRP